MVDQNVISAVEKESITNMRSALKGCINKDLNFERGLYQEAIDYMCRNGVSIDEIYDVHDEEIFNMNQAEWNVEYYNSVMADLLFNFSKERISHLKQVGQKVFVMPSSPKTTISKKSSTSVKSGNELKKYLPIIIIGGIIIMIIVAAILRDNR